MTDQDRFTLEQGNLRVHESSLQDRDLLFDEVCRELLDSREAKLVIDLTEVEYINSTCVGILAATFFQANYRKKSLVIRAGKRIVRLLRDAGMGEFIEIEEVG